MVAGRNSDLNLFDSTISITTLEFSGTKFDSETNENIDRRHGRPAIG